MARTVRRTLRSCLVNLPGRLVAALLAEDVVVQNVVVQVQWSIDGRAKTVFAGWSGLEAGVLLTGAPNGWSTSSNPSSVRREEEEVVEIDDQFALACGLPEGQWVELRIDHNGPVAQSVYFEPLTYSDWEIVELHARFLEHNLLSQVRAVTMVHPLVIYLSPSMTACVRVTKIDCCTDGFLYARLGPGAEVIVAPKAKTLSHGVSQAKEDAHRSAALNPAEIPTQQIINKSAGLPSDTIFLRSLVASEFTGFPDNYSPWKIYLNFSDIPDKFSHSKRFIICKIKPKPSSSWGQNKDLSDELKDTVDIAKRICVEVQSWTSAPFNHIVIGEELALALQIENSVGDIIKLSFAKPAWDQKVTTVHIRPIANSSIKRTISLQHNLLTSTSNLSKDTWIMVIKDYLTASGLLAKPLTDGMIIPIPDFYNHTTSVALLSFAAPLESWTLLPAKGKNVVLQIDENVSLSVPLIDTNEVSLNQKVKLVAMDDLVADSIKHVGRKAGILFTGKSGYGKSLILQTISRQAEVALLRTVCNVNCRLLSDERIPAIRETLHASMLEAAWHAPSLVVFDDLDRLTPAEVESMDSTRIRHISELFIQIVMPIIARNDISMLASASADSALHKVILSSHLFKEIKQIHSPAKPARKALLQEALRRLDILSVSDELYFDVSNLTDGFAAGDLFALVERACHFRLSRYLTQENGGRENGAYDSVNTSKASDSNSLAADEQLAKKVLKDVNKNDFQLALEGFVPIGLRGVKLETSSTSWSEIGGLSKVKLILRETLELPTKYAPIFAHSPLRLRSGILLYGYPGCGKTLLASAVARECGLNFISIKGPEILNKYIGASEKSIRDLFERAQSAKPCVLFFDEFDSIAPKRGHDSTGVTDRVVNQMLTQMDGAEGLEGVYVLAATSRPDLIDSALLRPGRLDKALLCDMPTAEERLDILKVLSKQMSVDNDVNFEELAQNTEAFTGADLQALLYNAHLETIHEHMDGLELKKKSEYTKKDQPSTCYEHFSLEAESVLNYAATTSKACQQQFELKVANILACQSPAQGMTIFRNEMDNSTTPLVRHEHLMSSLRSCRPSVPNEERTRLSRIYEEFDFGRDAKFPSGLASNKIGGRTTLM